MSFKSIAWREMADEYIETERKWSRPGDTFNRIHAKAAVSLLSDAQEATNAGFAERANDNINAAKLVLCAIIDAGGPTK